MSKQKSNNNKVTINDDLLFEQKIDNNEYKIDKINKNNIIMETPNTQLFGSPKISPKLRKIFDPNIKQLYKYDYKQLHNDLENNKYTGAYGWDNACFLAIAEAKANIDLSKFHSKRTKDEYYIKSFKTLLDNPETQKWWKRIVTFDPYGMTATNPTIAATDAILNFPELKHLKKDGKIVDNDGGIHVQKAAVYYAWNIPHLSERLQLTELELRKVLNKYTNNPKLLDTNISVFLPPVGGVTIYSFGDVSKIRDPKTEIAVRVHDECNGSDVFCTDICTCRPYLVFAIEKCVECAQRGGVGIIAYFRKEGRSLGEVVKYRVYNARRNQDGGDRPEKYFFQTCQIAGIEDARFQTMMPDVLNWLGIDRIDWLLSMSSEKYDAIIEAGIKVNQRVALPDKYVPKGAHVEILAKIAHGYHADEIKHKKTIESLRSLKMIRRQCKRIYDLALKDSLMHWTLNLDKLPVAVDAVVKCMLDKYPPDKNGNLNIPLHSRFRHFNETKLNTLINLWKSKHVSSKEQCRRLVDLVTISVLTDAGAGNSWKYINNEGKIFNRSEGIAEATFDMFINGLFSSDTALKTRVNSVGLKNLTTKDLIIGFQANEKNPMTGLNGRCELIQRLGNALEKYPEYFGNELFRPGNLLDYLLDHKSMKYDKKSGKYEISIHVLWKAIINGYENIWPKHMSGIRRGDVWVHNLLKKKGYPGSDMVPFHKLQQWLTYSLIEAFEYYNINFSNIDDMTCLAEYRNGGLFVDTNVLTLKNKTIEQRKEFYDVGSELVVEWRAMTIMLVDNIADIIRKKFNKTKEQLSLAKILEGGTWRAGRILAQQKRPQTKSPPVNIRSDGTVF